MPQRYTPAVAERFAAAFAMSEYHALQMPPYALNKVPRLRRRPAPVPCACVGCSMRVCLRNCR
jgi:hypothetical protein